MKKFSFLIASVFFAYILFAQTAIPVTRYKLAIFTPLDLDNAFNENGTYLYSGKSFPKSSIPGLEFYNGASFAIDSLNKMQLPLDVYVYDSKSSKESMEQQFSKCAADGVDLIIANCTAGQVTSLAKLAADKKITVLNATVPSDGNTSNNPYFVVLNSTLPTQVEGIYDYIKAKYPKQAVTIITRKTQSENYIRSIFETLNEYNKKAVNIKFVDANDEEAIKTIGNTTLPGQPGLFVVGSLDADFATDVLKQLSANSKNYSLLTVIGMPTWENINLNKADYKGLEIIYSTPFYNSRADAASKNIAAYYNKKIYSRPSDLVYRAFGLTYKFGRLLNQYGKSINKNLASKDYKTFFDFNIQPVYRNGALSHYENKKLYFLKYFNGSLKAVH